MTGKLTLVFFLFAVVVDGIVFLFIRFSTSVNPGDIVQLNLSKPCSVVDNDSPDSSIIVHPNTLISVTSVANSIACTRR